MNPEEILLSSDLSADPHIIIETVSCPDTPQINLPVMLSRAQQILQRAQEKHRGIVSSNKQMPQFKPLQQNKPQIKPQQAIEAPPKLVTPQKTTVVTPLPKPPVIIDVIIPEEPAKGIEYLKAYLFRRLGGQKCAFTSFGRSDDIESQALGKITTHVMARALGMDYAHSPFQNVASINVTKRWEQLLSIGGFGTKPLAQYLPHVHYMENKDLSRILQCQSFQPGWAHIYSDAHSFTNAFREELGDAWKDTIYELRTRYTGPKTSIFDRTSDEPGTRHVAVHIQCGDTLDYYRDVMNRLVQTALSETRYIFHIFSDKTEKEFAEIISCFPTTQLHLPEQQQKIHQNLPRNHAIAGRRAVLRPKLVSNNNTEDVFKMLVGADMLIMSKSDLSFLAAIYSGGTKIHPADFWIQIPFWCEQNDNWIRSDMIR